MHREILISALLALAAVLGSGCKSPPPHAWMNGPAQRAGVDDWRLLDRSRFALLQHDDRQSEADFVDACHLLDSAVAIPLDASQFDKLRPPREQPEFGTLAAGEPQLRPFLIRGVAFGGAPVWVQIWYSPSLNAFWIHQGSYNGENLLFSILMSHQYPLPAIVLVEKPPSQVFCTCLLAGDMIFSMQSPQPPLRDP